MTYIEKESTFKLISKLDNIEKLSIGFSTNGKYISGLELLTNIKDIELYEFNNSYFTDLAN